MDPQRVLQLKQQGDDEELFRYLLLSQCRELAECLPDVFEPVGGAMELLLPGKLMAKDGVVARMVALIPESDWSDHVEILGWMYQYYNAQAKDDFFKSKAKATAETLPAATQLFTPEWIVRYMVQNSLGRLWMLNNPQSALRERMEYYIGPPMPSTRISSRLRGEDITLCDPACGSGHIWCTRSSCCSKCTRNAATATARFRVSFCRRTCAGWKSTRAPRSWRVWRLPCALASMTAASSAGGCGRTCVWWRPWLSGKTSCPSAQLRKHPQLLDALAHLDEVGSLLNPTPEELVALMADAEAMSRAAAGGDMFADSVADRVAQAKEMCDALAERYDCVVANPPLHGKQQLQPLHEQMGEEELPRREERSVHVLHRARFRLGEGQGLRRDGDHAELDVPGQLREDAREDNRR